MRGKYTKTPEHCAKIAAALRGNRNSFGQKRGPETLARMSAAQRGENGSNWHGGRRKTDKGYVLVWSPTHPLANGRGYVFEHRLVMEAHVGRTLLPTEVCHHINGIRDDNRIDNLMLFNANAEHVNKFHGKGAAK